MPALVKGPSGFPAGLSADESEFVLNAFFLRKVDDHGRLKAASRSQRS